MSIELINIKKFLGEPPQPILKGLSLQIDDGEFVSIVGRSGSGKSTLLYVISTLDKPSEGKVLFDGHDPYAMSDEDLHGFRNKNIGFVFQFHYLLPELTAIENVLLPARKNKLHEQYDSRGKELLELFDLGKKMNRYPRQMSGGEQQRVAIARALLLSPHYLFADEPTGNLDSENGRKVMEILIKINQEQKTTIVLVTHEKDYALMASRQIHLADGMLI